MTDTGPGSASSSPVRQNPVPGAGQTLDAKGREASRAAPQKRLEWCPWHGGYYPPQAMYDLRRRALRGEDDAATARRYLDMAARLQRTCRQCRDRCPTVPVWAVAVRMETQRLKEVRYFDEG